MNPRHIEVKEIQGSPSAATRESAILFANGQTEDAVRVLQAATAGPEAGERKTWLLMLDLLRLNNDVREFELAAQRYALTFNRVPPPWDLEAREQALPAELRRGGLACCPLSDALSAATAVALIAIRDAASSQPVIRFDLRELRAIDPEGCGLLSAEFDRLATQGTGILLAGAERLEQLLHVRLKADSGKVEYWRLLLDLLQILGRQEDFETAAMEYGIALQTEAPVWQPLFLPTPPPAVVEEKRSSPRYQSGTDLFRLSGVMSGPRDPQLAELARFAFDKEYLNIHLAALQRMDFVCAGHFVNALAAWRQKGKTVRLIRCNAPVASLLAMLEATRYAKFVPEPEET